MLLGGWYIVLGGCWLTAMQNCWMFASCPCIVARLAARLLIVSCVAAYAAPKFDIVSVYDATNASSLTAAMP